MTTELATAPRFPASAPSFPIKNPPPVTALQLTGITLTFGGVRAIKGVDLTVAEFPSQKATFLFYPMNKPATTFQLKGFCAALIGILFLLRPALLQAAENLG